MSNENQPIAVIDSGVGGLTSLVEVEKLLPNEDVFYCGDNGNAPYGNRTGEEIVELTKNMFRYLQKQNVKAVAVACNTISSTFNSERYGHYEKEFNFPVISVISPAVDDVINKGYDEVGVVGTVFTIQTGEHKRQIQARNPKVKVFGEASKNLAALIEKGDLEAEALKQEVRSHVANLLAQHPKLKDIVLGCTHYPIVQKLFEKAAPQVTFINPARDQAEAVKDYLESHNLLRTNHTGKTTINSSGDEPVYHVILDEVGLDKDQTVNIIDFAKA